MTGVRPGPLAFSLPGVASRYRAMALPAEAFEPDQVLFGADAQAGIVRRLLTEAGAPPVFLPAPEMFHAPETFARIERLLPAPSRTGGPPPHLRFGPLRDCRLLKFAPNAHLLAEAPSRREIRISANPFAARAAVPAALGRVLRYASDAILTGLHGERPEHADLPAGFPAADIAAWARGADGPREAQAALASGRIERRAFAALPGADPTPGAPGPTVALPWNLADPGSAVPDIVLAFARFPGPAETGLGLTLLPYNEDALEPRLTRLVEEAGAVLARREGDLARKALFVARVRRPVPAPALRHLFPGVILDGGDPERAFVEARLRALGLPFVTHDPAPAEGPVDPDRRLERFEETRGVRLIETARPSRRACMELLAAAQALFGEVAAPFAPPMPPAIDPALFTGVPGGRA
ncbi:MULTISPECIES: hypothetical protein [Methylobacterium]|uniref:Uncharacterized protein n=2 Tax=Pseudomonadota TaxID=1224 RepID=A0ABQ4T1K8_9HYPH|nr:MULTISPECIES: hypothetical protein [Methylobacterium]PIU08434.1 MAG: hypothetical protein COT56_01555 [Methylobacterium sp. CG09_land_8_20_14_0_10_71_15]PIU11723.1 MAG: hypothetical protein COT28_18795 [Methylobacterium sp. CG08_land_8_20_14_0_20_71_15]GBU20079.1 hypothetical protein AwMethylo_42940 [Methylobacterium sp.]GJE08689.1 hypothetical protein AOPFMNJM_4032 [Methylobacterium jeotgali]